MGRLQPRVVRRAPDRSPAPADAADEPRRRDHRGIGSDGHRIPHALGLYPIPRQGPRLLPRRGPAPLVLPEIVLGAALLTVFSTIELPLGILDHRARPLVISLPLTTLILIAPLQLARPEPARSRRRPRLHSLADLHSRASSPSCARRSSPRSSSRSPPLSQHRDLHVHERRRLDHDCRFRIYILPQDRYHARDQRARRDAHPRDHRADLRRRARPDAAHPRRLRHPVLRPRIAFRTTPTPHPDHHTAPTEGTTMKKRTASLALVVGIRTGLDRLLQRRLTASSGESTELNIYAWAGEIPALGLRRIRPRRPASRSPSTRSTATRR